MTDIPKDSKSLEGATSAGPVGSAHDPRLGSPPSHSGACTCPACAPALWAAGIKGAKALPTSKTVIELAWRIVNSAMATCASANSVLVHRQLIGELREALSGVSPDDTRIPCGSECWPHSRPVAAHTTDTISASSSDGASVGIASLEAGTSHRPRFSDETPENLARRFHEAYERLAPSFGYETRQETRQFDPTSKNGRLMIAVCAEIGAGSPLETSDNHHVVTEYQRGFDDGFKRAMDGVRAVKTSGELDRLRKLQETALALDDAVAEFGLDKPAYIAEVYQQFHDVLHDGHGADMRPVETCGKPFGDDVREFRCTEPAGHPPPCKQSPLKTTADALRTDDDPLKPEKAHETLGEELARKSVETFEAEKASEPIGHSCVDGWKVGEMEDCRFCKDQ